MSPRLQGLEEHPACISCGQRDPLIIEHKAYPVYNYSEGFAHRPCLRELRAYNRVIAAIFEAGWTQEEAAKRFVEILNNWLDEEPEQA